MQTYEILTEEIILTEKVALRMRGTCWQNTHKQHFHYSALVDTCCSGLIDHGQQWADMQLIRSVIYVVHVRVTLINFVQD